MKGFLQHTAVSLVTRFGWKKLQSLTLVFPTHRAGLVLKNELKDLQKREHHAPVFLPEITTLSELSDTLSPLYAEDELLLVFRLYRLYKEITHESLTPDLFYDWGRQLLTDFNNIDKSIGTPEEVQRFFRNAVEAKQLEELDIDNEVRMRLEDLWQHGEHAYDENSIRRKFTLLWQNMPDIYTRLNAELDAEQKGYEGMRMRRAVTEADTWLPRYADRTFIFIGFNYLMPVEKDLMTLLHDRNQALFYWDYADNFDANGKAYSFIRRHIADLGNEAEVTHWTSPRQVSVVAATTVNAQAQYAGQWLREHYTAHGQSTAIVICDEQMLEPVIYALPPVTLAGDTQPAPVNITKGFPLSSTQIYAKVMAYLSDRHHDLRPDETYPQLLDRLLEEVVSPAEKAARDSAIEAPERENTWQWLLIQESLYQTRRIINQFRQLLQTPVLQAEIQTLSLLRSLLRRLLSSVSLPFNGEPITDIQVMGVLETRMLDFDNLLLLNVEEGIVPRQESDLSFIPYYLRKAYSMQTREESASVYAYNFFRLLSRAGNTTLLFSDADTAMGRKTMSRFIMQMLVSPQFQITKYTLSENNQLTATPLINPDNNPTSLYSLLEKDTDNQLYYKTDSIQISPTLRGKEGVISPSALSTYIDCPRRFYLQYILGVRADDPETLIFAPNILGSFVHSAMEYIYKGICSCRDNRPHSIAPQTLQPVLNDTTLMEQVLDAAYTAQNNEYNRTHPTIESTTPHYIKEEHRMENTVIRSYIRRVLERDIQDAKQPGLQICLLEQKRTFPVDLGDDLGIIRIGGKIDRLDIVGTTMRVVDYKTGSYTRKKLSVDSLDKLFSDKDAHYVLQTLIYSEAVAYTDHTDSPLPLEPNLYFPQRKLTTPDLQTTVSIEKQEVHNYTEVRDRFLPALTDKLREVVTTTSFPQVEEKECSPLCPFLQICARSPQTFNA